MGIPVISRKANTLPIITPGAFFLHGFERTFDFELRTQKHISESPKIQTNFRFPKFSKLDSASEHRTNIYVFIVTIEGVLSCSRECVETDAMAASSKFDLSSASPDRPLYTQRASYAAATLDRSGSFRENMENPILSALPSMSRSSSTVTQGEVTNFLQCLRFDPKSMATDHKRGDFKQLSSAALGLPPDDSPSGSSKGKLPSPSPEELKRLKAGLRESLMKARDRVKIFSEALSVDQQVFSKCTFKEEISI
ncbi:hypothetical protein F0562_009701 [Nyssa sinensis]|uniref:Uncharacterized protein n=1 Tax=Nyssa sinensis TaxID=561372 RepID=A0A5J5A000_9ASTE|nr:hypothetical protein F0562_009701 [Nyssa sinensis]